MLHDQNKEKTARGTLEVCGVSRCMYAHIEDFRVSMISCNIHPKTLVEIAMVLSTNSGFFPSNSHVSATFSILLRFGEFWIPTNCEKFNADGSLMERTNLDKSVW